MSDPLAAVREALAGERAWLVGGAVRDRLLGRRTDDLDVALDGDVAAAARRLRSVARGVAFPLSEAFGGWRVVAPGHAWHVDILPLARGHLDADLAARDFTINAMAEPLGGGELVDPTGGAADLAARRLRAVGRGALATDPRRTVRAVRLATELGLAIEPETLGWVREHAPRLDTVAAERTFAELKRIVAADRPAEAVRLMEDAGVASAVLPELVALRGVGQNVYHHADVHDHTLEVLDAVAALERDPSPLGERAGAVAAELGRPLAHDMTRWDAMRFAALLHDIAKPATRDVRPDGRITFIGHDAVGADMSATILRRLRTSERLRAHVGALARHHLRLGFLVHERPLDPRAVHRYLVATRPRAVDVTVFTVADRLATRGRSAERAIHAHLGVARTMLDHALAPEPAPLLRGDELARALGIRTGPRVGELLARLEEDRFAGVIATREEAVERARSYLEQ